MEKYFLCREMRYSNYFRIPTFVSTVAEQWLLPQNYRYGGTHDAKSNIDIAFARSKDSGETWILNTSVVLKLIMRSGNRRQRL